MLHLTRNQLILAVLAFVFSIVFSAYSLIIANHANSIAEEALSHQNIIEESDLKVGIPQLGKDKNIYPSIRIPLINGYYARYPTQIYAVLLKLNGKTTQLQFIPPLESDNTTYPKDFILVERDKPTYLKFVFFNESEYLVSEYDRLYTIKYIVPKEYLGQLNEKNDMLVEIRYIDFSKMKEFTVICDITFIYSNKEINNIHLNGVGRNNGTALPKETVSLTNYV